ncbi:MAG: nucleoside triphosphate pyrophosphohydrolase [Nitrospiria bacterium]
MSKTFDALLEVMVRLRGEGGCPWDREQTSESLKPYLIEEAYEVYEAIEDGRAEPLCEELGDLLFQVLFHAEIAKEKNLFDIESVLKATTEKMIRRHPHVFSTEAPEGQDASPMDSKTVLAKWEVLKSKENRHRDRKSALDGIPKQLPALLRAHQLQARAARVGFDWKTPEPVLAKVEEEVQELREALENQDKAEIENELGDLLFSLVNVARFLRINPEDALRGTIQRFTGRFQKMESAAKTKNGGLESLTLEEMDALWEAAKLAERSTLPTKSV